MQVVRFEFVGVVVVAFNVSPLRGWSWQGYEFAVARLMRPHGCVLSVSGFGGGVGGVGGYGLRSKKLAISNAILNTL